MHKHMHTILLQIKSTTDINNILDNTQQKW